MNSKIIKKSDFLCETLTNVFIANRNLSPDDIGGKYVQKIVANLSPDNIVENSCVRTVCSSPNLCLIFSLYITSCLREGGCRFVIFCPEKKVAGLVV